MANRFGGVGRRSLGRDGNPSGPAMSRLPRPAGQGRLHSSVAAGYCTVMTPSYQSCGQLNLYSPGSSGVNSNTFLSVGEVRNR